MQNRKSLRRKREKETNTEKRQKLCDDILVLTDKINYLKQEVVYCQKIEEQNQKIKTNIKEIQEKENENEKNKKKGEIQK